MLSHLNYLLRSEIHWMHHLVLEYIVRDRLSQGKYFKWLLVLDNLGGLWAGVGRVEEMEGLLRLLGLNFMVIIRTTANKNTGRMVKYLGESLPALQGENSMGNKSTHLGGTQSVEAILTFDKSTT